MIERCGHLLRADPEVERAAAAAVDRLARARFCERLHARDATLFSERSEDEASVRRRCGWLEVETRAVRALPRLCALADELRGEGYARVMLLGMGGSSLFPLVISRLASPGAGLPLEVVDTVLPEAVAPALDRLAERDTLVLVSSKSGTTVEALTLASLAEQAGAAPRMVAVTDPDSPLEARAGARSYRAVVHGQPDVGGRFSALTAFGLLPALLAGYPVDALLAGASEVARACAPDAGAPVCPPVVLGAILGAVAGAGTDVLTPRLRGDAVALVPWVEQLVAESTGKRSRGIWPAAAAPGPPVPAGADRLVAGPDVGRFEGAASLSWSAPSSGGARAVGAEVLRWELAVAAAASVLRINPFDEPDVGLAKRLTAESLGRLEAGGRLPWPEPTLTSEGVTLYGGACAASSVEAALVGWLDRLRAEGRIASLLLYLPPTPVLEARARRLQARIEAATDRPCTVGFGPRYLHATGQLHKGGPDRALHLLLTAATGPEIPLPGRPGVRLGDLAHAQALSDARALRDRDRPVAHLHVEAAAADALGALEAALPA